MLCWPTWASSRFTTCFPLRNQVSKQSPKKAITATPPSCSRNCSYLLYFTFSGNYSLFYQVHNLCSSLHSASGLTTPQKQTETVFLKFIPSPWIITHSPELNLIVHRLGICHKAKKPNKWEQTYTTDRQNYGSLCHDTLWRSWTVSLTCPMLISRHQTFHSYTRYLLKGELKFFVLSMNLKGHWTFFWKRNHYSVS